GLHPAEWNLNTGDTDTWSYDLNGSSCTLNFEFRIEDSATLPLLDETAQWESFEDFEAQLQADFDAAVSGQGTDGIGDVFSGLGDTTQPAQDESAGEETSDTQRGGSIDPATSGPGDAALTQ
ncbi:MAG: hypothetical protein Q9183_006845, partial [Haloplaca sp. 2 TL-2023]